MAGDGIGNKQTEEDMNELRKCCAAADAELQDPSACRRAADTHRIQRTRPRPLFRPWGQHPYPRQHRLSLLARHPHGGPLAHRVPQPLAARHPHRPRLRASDRLHPVPHLDGEACAVPIRLYAVHKLVLLDSGGDIAAARSVLGVRQYTCVQALYGGDKEIIRNIKKNYKNTNVMSHKVVRTAKERFKIYRKSGMLWRVVHEAPSFSLAKLWLREKGVRVFVYTEEC